MPEEIQFGLVITAEAEVTKAQPADDGESDEETE